MEQEEPKKKLLPHFSRADITALIALLISLAALGVSVYEAQIMREQQAIMQTQQKASFFPYITESQRFSFGKERNFTYEIMNKGIGPAKIRSAQLKLNGEPVNSYIEIETALKKILPPESNFALSYSNPNNYFLNPKEKITAVNFSFDEFDNHYAVIGSLLFEYELCYCSNFQDCWSIQQQGEEPTDGCN